MAAYGMSYRAFVSETPYHTVFRFWYVNSPENAFDKNVLSVMKQSLWRRDDGAGAALEAHHL